MLKSNVVIPNIRIDKCISEDYVTFHLIIDGTYEGCYMTKADLLERLSLLIVNEVSRL